jgi:hypothetical protein
MAFQKSLMILLGFLAVALFGSCINNIKTPTETYTPSTEEPPPPDLLLISPEDNAVLDNGRPDPWDSIIWDFDWSDVYGATLYQIYVTLMWGNVAYKTPRINQTTTSSSFHYEVRGYRPDWEGMSSLSGWTWKVVAGQEVRTRTVWY